MKLKGRDLSTELIWAAALVGMIRYSAAFLASDVGQIIGLTSEIITILLGISGFAMGILGTFGTTYLFDGWRRKMPATGQTWPFKFVVLTCFVMAAFVFELAILVPFTVSRMEHTTMSEVLKGGVWWWSIAVNIMPMLLIGGVSVGNQVVNVGAQDTGNLPTDWRKVRKELSPEQIMRIATGKTEKICFEFGITDRTARNWRKNAQKELEKARIG
jgi:hypothetical protein